MNSSGPISLGGLVIGESISLELGNLATTETSLNDTNVRTLAGVPSGIITMPTDFYGKTLPFTQLGSKLPGVTLFSQFGIVALSADGTTMAVGAPNSTSPGAVYVYNRSGSTWVQEGSAIIGTGSVGGARQGTDVALSADGNTLAIGGSNDNSGVGAVWVFTRSGGVWTQQGSKLVGTGNLGASTQSIVALSADGNTLAVGGGGDNTNTGATWIFTRSGGTWSQQGSKLIGTGATGAAFQGGSVSLSQDGNTLVVGGQLNNTNIGANWVFVRSGATWSQQGSELIANDSQPATQGVRQGCSTSVSSDGNTFVTGGFVDNLNIGAAWVFTRSGGVWTQQGSKLVGVGYSTSPTNPQQGISVSISGDANTIAVGGFSDDNNIGATWIFVKSSGNWIQPNPKLVGTGFTSNSRQGNPVKLSTNGSTLAVGAISDNLRGAVWTFVK
jgi:hypothetical protein